MKLLTFVIVLFGMTSCAGMKDLHPNGVTIEDSVRTNNKKLYNHGNAMDWIALNFNDSNNVVKVAHKLFSNKWGSRGRNEFRP
jgi:hypothetical protein